MTEPARPVIRYHGGKWKLAPWIIGHFPAHETYVESFGGGGSVLMRKPRSYGEVYNDLDSEVVNCFRVMQDPERAIRLRELIELTPFARDEFDLGYEHTDDDIERARRLIIRSFMGFGSTVTRTNLDGRPQRTGFRANSNRSGTTPAHDWRNYPTMIADFVDRLRGVVVENRDAAECMRQHDSAATLHYVDPPYPHETRCDDAAGSHGGYRFEMTNEEHENLARTLLDLEGMVVVSSYESDLYSRLFDGWSVVKLDTFADGARARCEALFLNPACAAAQRQAQLPMEHTA